MFPDSTALMKARFTGITREALGERGLPQEQFAGNSFRIGAATAAVQADLEDSWIKTLGRWEQHCVPTVHLDPTGLPGGNVSSPISQLSANPVNNTVTAGIVQTMSANYNLKKKELVMMIKW